VWRPLEKKSCWVGVCVQQSRVKFELASRDLTITSEGGREGWTARQKNNCFWRIITREVAEEYEDNHLERQNAEHVKYEVGSEELRCSAQRMRDQAVRVERRVKTNYVSVTPTTSCTMLNSNSDNTEKTVFSDFSKFSRSHANFLTLRKNNSWKYASNKCHIGKQQNASLLRLESRIGIWLPPCVAVKLICVCVCRLNETATGTLINSTPCRTRERWMICFLVRARLADKALASMQLDWYLGALPMIKPLLESATIRYS